MDEKSKEEEQDNDPMHVSSKNEGRVSIKLNSEVRLSKFPEKIRQSQSRQFQKQKDRVRVSNFKAEKIERVRVTNFRKKPNRQS